MAISHNITNLTFQRRFHLAVSRLPWRSRDWGGAFIALHHSTAVAGTEKVQHTGAKEVSQVSRWYVRTVDTGGAERMCT